MGPEFGIEADELARRIARGEGTRMEFKQGLPGPDKVARTLAAFANTRGGILVVGVGDRGQILGAPRPEETRAEIARIAAEDVEPPLLAHTAVLGLEGRPVVVCAVGHSDARPHGARLERGGKVVTVRVGSSTRRAEGPALASLRQGNGSRSVDEFEQRILNWVARQGDSGTSASGRTTPDAFAKANNVGRQRALRAFIRLEREGYLMGHGDGLGRSYSPL